MLDIRPISITSNFFHLGGHSLSAVRLIALIRKQFHIDLPLTTIFQRTTIEQLAATLRQQRVPQLPSSLITLQPEGIKTPFFCVHPGGGGVLCYIELARQMGTERPFHALQAPGLYGEQEAHTRIEDMATHYIRIARFVQPRGPYLLGGWSMGGLIAFEMAHQLLEQGEQVGLLSILDIWAPLPDRYPKLGTDAKLICEAVDSYMLYSPASFSADTLPSPLAEEVLSRLTGDEQMRYLMSVEKSLKQIPDDTELPEMYNIWKVYKTNIQAEYDYRPTGKYPQKITLFHAEEVVDKDIHTMGTEIDVGDPTLEWDKLTSECVEIHVVPGTHHKLVDLPYVKQLADLLKKCIDRVEHAESM